MEIASHWGKEGLMGEGKKGGFPLSPPSWDMKIQSLKCSLKTLYPAWENLHQDVQRQVRLQEPPAAEADLHRRRLLID